MGLRSIMKYLALFRVAMALVRDGLAWLDNAKDEDSPGGEGITAIELLELTPIIESAIVEGLGLAVRVKVEMPEE